MLNLNFAIVLDSIITTLLCSTQPIHFDTKILHSSLFFPNSKLAMSHKSLFKTHFSGLVTFINWLFMKNPIHFFGYLRVYATIARVLMSYLCSFTQSPSQGKTLFLSCLFPLKKVKYKGEHPNTTKGRCHHVGLVQLNMIWRCQRLVRLGLLLGFRNKKQKVIVELLWEPEAYLANSFLHKGSSHGHLLVYLLLKTKYFFYPLHTFFTLLIGLWLDALN